MQDGHEGGENGGEEEIDSPNSLLGLGEPGLLKEADGISRRPTGRRGRAQSPKE
jgi:hypothetical protein